VRSTRGNNRAAALSRGAAPVQVNRPSPGMVLAFDWSDRTGIGIDDQLSKIE